MYAQRYVQARSRNDFWRRIAIIIAYSDGVFVTLGIQYA